MPPRPTPTRREFLGRSLAAGAGLALTPRLDALADDRAVTRDPRSGGLRGTFPDLERHFVFEYYPWYGGPPDYEHWDYLDRKPPLDIASPLHPAARALRRAARWRCSSSTHAGSRGRRRRRGPVVVGPRQLQDRAVPLHPRRDAAPRPQGHVRARALQRRSRARTTRTTSCTSSRSTARSAAGTPSCSCATPTGASARSSRASLTILPETSTDCLGVTRPVGRLHAGRGLAQPDRRRAARRCARTSTTSLSSPTRSSSRARRPPASTASGSTTTSSGRTRYRPLAEGASRPACSSPSTSTRATTRSSRASRERPLLPPRAPSRPGDRGLDLVDRARDASARPRPLPQRIRDSFEATLAVQRDPALTNAPAGFLLVYINSFNEWHEGHAFEPMKDAAELTAAERRDRDTATRSTATTA